VPKARLCGQVNAFLTIATSDEIVAQVRAKLPDASEDEIRHEIDQVLDRLLKAPRTERERKIALRSWTSRAIYELMRGCKIEARDRGDRRSSQFSSRMSIFFPTTTGSLFSTVAIAKFAWWVIS
jgi:hypothetical protein